MGPLCVTEDFVDRIARSSRKLIATTPDAAVVIRERFA